MLVANNFIGSLSKDPLLNSLAQTWNEDNAKVMIPRLKTIQVWKAIFSINMAIRLSNFVQAGVPMGYQYNSVSAVSLTLIMQSGTEKSTMIWSLLWSTFYWAYLTCPV